MWGVTGADVRVRVRLRTRHALHEAHVELDLVPFDHSALDLEEGQADRRLPVLRRLEDEVVERVANLPGASNGQACEAWTWAWTWHVWDAEETRPAPTSSC